MSTSDRRDRALGLDRPITRRDFVYGSAVLAGAALSGCRPGAERPTGSSRSGGGDDYGFGVGPDWYGPGGVGDYAASHGNTPEVVGAAHRIRAGEFDEPTPDAVDSDQEYDLVVVGGGFSGLSAAHHARRLRPDARVLVLENHPIFGGEAKRNDFVVDGVRLSGPQGSNGFIVLPATGDPDDYFTALGIPREFEYAEPGGAAAGMRIPSDNYAFLHWQHDLFDVGHHFRGGPGDGWVREVWGAGLDDTPWSPEVREGFRRARATDAQEHAEGEVGPWLDSMTMREYYEGVLGLPPEVPDYVDPILASIIGLGTDAISAWWGLHFGLPGFSPSTSYADYTFQSFPGGNAGLARHFLKGLIPEGIEGGGDLGDVIFGSVRFDRLDRPGSPVRLRLDSTVVRVEHEGALDRSERVAVTYVHGGRVHRVRGRHVVMASGGWVNRRVVKDLPDAHLRAYDQFAHSPVLVANVALHNWRFLERLGVSAAIWDEGFGFSCNIRRPMLVPGHPTEPLDPERPVVMTFYVPIFRPGRARKAQGVEGRAELLGTSFAGYERRIREQMATLFSPGGFDPAADIAGIVLNRWGHAYVNPGPGFMFGAAGEPAPPDVIREPIGRIAIGHSELGGHQNWTGAAGEGRRAVEALLA